MKRTRFTEEQIIGVLKEVEAGAKLARGWAVDIRTGSPRRLSDDEKTRQRTIARM
jgi:hypothetical protein